MQPHRVGYGPAVLCTLVACAGAPPPSSAPVEVVSEDAAPSHGERLEVAPSPTAAAVTRPVQTARPAAPTQEDARRFLEQFVRPSANHAMLTKTMRPSSEDYRSLFDEATAAKLDAAYAPEWDQARMLIAPKPGQTEVKVWAATTEDLKNRTGSSQEFPGGYALAAEHLAPGTTIFRFKFLEPGKDLGMAFDGLAYVRGRWVFVPKPWRVLGSRSD